MCPIVATHRYPVPKYFKMVEHFAGDSTINRVSVGTFINDEDDDEDDDEEEDGRNVKILNIHLGNGELNIENEIEEISEEDDEDDEDDDDDNDDNFSQESEHLVEIVPESTSKTLHISGFDESIEMDYKKMSISKLRSLVVEKGLSNESSKLKKVELLQLLSSV